MREAALAGARRDSFAIYPRQLFATPSALVETSARRLTVAGQQGALLCHGPYWLFRQGAYRVELIADISGEIELTVAARFGHPVASFRLDGKTRMATFVAARDLVQCELVFRAVSREARVAIERIAVQTL